MKLEDFHDFYVASAGCAGALIGLLFVAISVSRERLSASGQGVLHRVRASSALGAFSNALVISLFGLIPDSGLGPVALSVSILGLLSVVANLLALVRGHAITWRSLHDIAFVASLAAIFTVQLISGLNLQKNSDSSANESIAVLVIVCFLVGIGRSWDLIGGPQISLRQQAKEIGQDVSSRLRDDRPAAQDPSRPQEAAPTTGNSAQH